MEKQNKSQRFEDLGVAIVGFATHGGMQTTQNNNQPVSPVDLAEVVEQRIHESLEGSPAAFHLEQARLYGVNVRAEGELMLTLVLEHADIYTLLDTPESACARMFDAGALVTCGWAAPISETTGEPEGAPSEHPGRRRVRLVVVVGDAGVASVLRFEDDADNPILDAGEARGPLAEAVNSFWYDPPVVS